MNDTLRLIASALLTLWLAASLTFGALRLLPGDAVQAQYLEASAELQAVLHQNLHWDEPIGVQYIRFLLDIMQGNLGVSLYTGRPVAEMLAERFLPTAELALWSMGIAIIWGIVGGIVAAQRIMGISPFFRLIIGLAVSVPIYWTGTLVIFVIAIHIGGVRENSLLPAFVLGFHIGGVIARNLQANIQALYRADFVRTAHAKGLAPTDILVQHILRVAVLPVIQIIALQAGFLLSGAVITESLFQRAGIGILLIDAVHGRDYPVVQGIVLMIATVFIVVNRLADGLTSWLDPRLNS
jgi:ABC-type dipeptide/oligopeptide/nickel transport system permease component